MKYVKVLLVCLGLVAMFSCNHKEKVHAPKKVSNGYLVRHNNKAACFVSRKDTGDFIVYTPIYKSVRLICGKRPKLDDALVVYCAEAAFTGECLDTFVHDNIAGDHVADGIYYRGYKAKTNTGAFIWYQGKWKFAYDNYAKELRFAASHGGMGFGQNMVIYQGCALPLFRKDNPQNIYRVLCEWEGKLCVVEAKHELAYSEFVTLLQKLKIKYALYLDMGPGWNYSWYRDSSGTIHEIHPLKPWSKYQTNWIVFYAKK